MIENTVVRKPPLNWHELAPDRWEELYGADRIDLAVEGSCFIKKQLEDAGIPLLASSIIAALLQREREGIGQRVDITMQDFMIGLSRSQR